MSRAFIGLLPRFWCWAQLAALAAETPRLSQLSVTWLMPAELTSVPGPCAGHLHPSHKLPEPVPCSSTLLSLNRQSVPRVYPGGLRFAFSHLLPSCASHCTHAVVDFRGKHNSGRLLKVLFFHAPNTPASASVKCCLASVGVRGSSVSFWDRSMHHDSLLLVPVHNLQCRAASPSYNM